MTIEDIQSIISTDETRTLELKKTTGELKDGMHSACAFLNTDGGWLIFGIAPTSLKMIEGVLHRFQDLERVLRNFCRWRSVRKRRVRAALRRRFSGA